MHSETHQNAPCRLKVLRSFLDGLSYCIRGDINHCPLSLGQGVSSGSKIGKWYCAGSKVISSAFLKELIYINAFTQSQINTNKTHAATIAWRLLLER